MNKIEQVRKTQPKRFALARIGVAMDDVNNYAKSKQCNRMELRSMVVELNARIKSLCDKYCISGKELQAYCTFHNYQLSF